MLWMLQDLLTVLVGGGMQVPGIFLMGVVFRVLTDEGEDRLWAIWSAFTGGLLWDLRWVGIPGFFTLGYVAVVMLSLWLLNTVPVQGRTLPLALLLLELSQLLPPLLPVLILGGNTGGGFFLTQQLCALPALFLCLYLYSRWLRASRA